LELLSKCNSQWLKNAGELSDHIIRICMLTDYTLSRYEFKKYFSQLACKLHANNFRESMLASYYATGLIMSSK
jgi:hypothetical protein